MTGHAPTPDYRALYEACKLQARMHAQEARTANGTIAEIYQIVTGSCGEPGNWNGAEPIRAYVAKRDAERAELVQALEECAANWSSPPGIMNDCFNAMGDEFQRRLNIARSALCFCREDAPFCHADVLLDIANPKPLP